MDCRPQLQHAPIILDWHERGAGFIVREHGVSPNPHALEAPRRAGRIETGTVHEQPVAIEDGAGQPLVLRRIQLDLNEPTEDGEAVIVLLTNLPKSQFTARKIARLYRRRRSIENLPAGLSEFSCSRRVDIYTDGRTNRSA